MTKRIVSGVFLLVALGALGLILAGALTSGEQLIVRFLTAIIVAALGLYVISDLRLQANDDSVASGTRTTMSSPRVTTGGDQPPANSTAAFMATVTGKKSSSKTTADLDKSTWNNGRSTAQTQTLVRPEPTIELTGRGPKAWVGVAPEGDDVAAAQGDNGATEGGHNSGGGLGPSDPTTPADDDEVSPYSGEINAASEWPFNEKSEPSTSAVSNTDDDVDGLVAIFARKTEEDLAKHAAGHFDANPVSTEPGSTPQTSTGTVASSSPALTAEVRSAAEVEAEATEPATAQDQQPTGEDHAGVADPAPDGPIQAEQGEVNGVTVVQPDLAIRDVDRSALILKPSDRVAAASYAKESIAPIIDLRLPQPIVRPSAEIDNAIRSGELEVITSLMEQGVLSANGPVSDRDVRTMVYVAFTSSELRKILLAGGTIDGDNSDLDLGDVEVFEPHTTEIDVREEYGPDSQAL